MHPAADPIQQTFEDLTLQVRRAQFRLPDAVAESARAFEQALAAHPTPAQRVLFTALNIAVLGRIERHMEYLDLHDRIFDDLLRLDEHPPIDIGRTFKAFIKGITYFSDQEDIPIYPVGIGGNT